MKMECSASAAELRYDGGGESEIDEEEFKAWVEQALSAGGEFYPWGRFSINEGMENFDFYDIAPMLALGDCDRVGRFIREHVLIYFQTQAVVAAMDRDIGRYNVE